MKQNGWLLALEIADRMARNSPEKNDPPPAHYCPLGIWYALKKKNLKVLKGKTCHKKQADIQARTVIRNENGAS
jgi:hypothetical protein